MARVTCDTAILAVRFPMQAARSKETNCSAILAPRHVCKSHELLAEMPCYEKTASHTRPNER
jgi:hypothetical protein